MVPAAAVDRAAFRGTKQKMHSEFLRRYDAVIAAALQDEEIHRSTQWSRSGPNRRGNKGGSLQRPGPQPYM